MKRTPLETILNSITNKQCRVDMWRETGGEMRIRTWCLVQMSVSGGNHWEAQRLTVCRFIKYTLNTAQKLLG